MKGFDFSVNSKVSKISQQYSKDTNISIEDAMKLLFTSKTYQALIDIETGIYLEMFEYVYDMFLEEMREIKHES